MVEVVEGGGGEEVHSGLVVGVLNSGSSQAKVLVLCS